MSSILFESARTISRMDLSDRIKHAIKVSGNTQSSVASQLKISRAAVNQWCNGKTENLKMENLFDLARVTTFNPEWIGVGRGPERPPEHRRGLSAGEEKLLEIWRRSTQEAKRQTMSQAIFNQVTFRKDQTGAETSSLESAVDTIMAEIDELNLSGNN